MPIRVPTAKSMNRISLAPIARLTNINGAVVTARHEMYSGKDTLLHEPERFGKRERAYGSAVGIMYGNHKKIGWLVR
jgi:hypothetical protein